MKISDIDMRDAFISKLYEEAKADSSIIFLSSEFGAPSLDKFRSNLPNQFFNTAISEQNSVSVAAGLSLGGKKVFLYSIASFITLRCYEQIKLDLCSMKLPVTLLGVGPCYAYSVDGPTHHATEDISVMRALANMEIYCPSDSNMAAALVDVSLRSSGPIYIRIDRGRLPLIYDKNKDLHTGFSVLKEGKDVLIISTGVMVHSAMEIVQELAKHSIQAGVVDIYRLKPVNAKNVMAILKRAKKILTLEEHIIHGGLGSIIAELLTDHHVFVPLKRLAIEDESLYAYGIRETLHWERGLDKESVSTLIMNWLQ
jgi:transketolase